VLPLAVLAKEVQFVPSFLYGHHHGAREFDDAAALLAELAGLPSVVVTHRYPLERAGEAFRTAADRGSGAIKVLLAPGAP
jgi:threonine dehydrogenase-like Zn-dependent dehydrogenase